MLTEDRVHLFRYGSVEYGAYRRHALWGSWDGGETIIFIAKDKRPYTEREYELPEDVEGLVKRYMSQGGYADLTLQEYLTKLGF